jgi:hypothetical protein
MSGTIQVSAGDTVTKDPDSSDIYQFDWDDVLPTGSTISSSVFVFALVRYTGVTLEDAAALAALTQSSATVHVDGRATQVLLAGGTLGAEYQVTNRVTLDDGQIEDGSFRIVSQQK